jgi:hypothetical protein
MAATASFLGPNITQLELFANGYSVGSATGFFLDKDKVWYLISNWHVFSGKNPVTGQARHSSGALPDQVRFFSYDIKDDKLQTKSWTIPLVDPETSDSLWLQHSVAGQNIDLAAVTIDHSMVGSAKHIFDTSGHDPNMYVDAAYEVFLPGYPLGIFGPGRLPVWKRASIATSLEVGSDPFFLVDTASREGMSGSPCFAISNWQHYRKDPETDKLSVVRQPLSWRLLGVYSGRKNASDALEAQLGIVWKSERLLEVLASGRSGTYEIREPIR